MEYFDRLRGFTEEAVDWQKVPRQRPFNGKLLPNYFQKSVNDDCMDLNNSGSSTVLLSAYAKTISGSDTAKPGIARMRTEY